MGFGQAIIALAITAGLLCCLLCVISLYCGCRKFRQMNEQRYGIDPSRVNPHGSQSTIDAIRTHNPRAGNHISGLTPVANAFVAIVDGNAGQSVRSQSSLHAAHHLLSGSGGNVVSSASDSRGGRYINPRSQSGQRHHPHTGPHGHHPFARNHSGYSQTMHSQPKNQRYSQDVILLPADDMGVAITGSGQGGGALSPSNQQFVTTTNSQNTGGIYMGGPTTNTTSSGGTDYIPMRSRPQHYSQNTDTSGVYLGTTGSGLTSTVSSDGSGGMSKIIRALVNPPHNPILSPIPSNLTGPTGAGRPPYGARIYDGESTSGNSSHGGGVSSHRGRGHRGTTELDTGSLRQIDHSELVLAQVLGRGKFGQVYKASWIDKTVAVKRFRGEDVSEEAFEDFRRELGVAKTLPSHDNVLKIYGYTYKPYCIVVEFLNGGSVEAILSLKHPSSKRHHFAVRDVTQMILDAARGLMHLHKAKIVHRDIAARNLLLEFKVVPGTGQMKARVVVCDFGLSRVTQAAENQNTTESHVGPLKWMSPESIRQQLYSTQTDAYSFGILMWEMMSGAPPYPEMKVVAVAIQVMQYELRPAVPEWFPESLAFLMQRCWQTSARFRPTFSEIIKHLEETIRMFHRGTKLSKMGSHHSTTERNKPKDKDILDNPKVPMELSQPTTAQLVAFPELVEQYYRNQPTPLDFDLLIRKQITEDKNQAKLQKMTLTKTGSDPRFAKKDDKNRQSHSQSHNNQPQPQSARMALSMISSEKEDSLGGHGQVSPDLVAATNAPGFARSQSVNVPSSSASRKSSRDKSIPHSQLTPIHSVTEETDTTASSQPPPSAANHVPHDTLIAMQPPPGPGEAEEEELNFEDEEEDEEDGTAILETYEKYERYEKDNLAPSDKPKTMVISSQTNLPNCLSVQDITQGDKPGFSQFESNPVGRQPMGGGMTVLHGISVQHVPDISADFEMTPGGSPQPGAPRVSGDPYQLAIAPALRDKTHSQLLDPSVMSNPLSSRYNSFTADGARNHPHLLQDPSQSTGHHPAHSIELGGENDDVGPIHHNMHQSVTIIQPQHGSRPSQSVEITSKHRFSHSASIEVPPTH